MPGNYMKLPPKTAAQDLGMEQADAYMPKGGPLLSAWDYEAPEAAEAPQSIWAQKLPQQSPQQQLVPNAIQGAAALRAARAARLKEMQGVAKARRIPGMV